TAHPFLFFFLLRPPPRSPLFPYTTLFRSEPSRLLFFLACLVSSQHAVLHGIEQLFQVFHPDEISGLVVHEKHGGFLLGFQVIVRSEEHTSELQSRENLVCRLLLEKKKTRN